MNKYLRFSPKTGRELVSNVFFGSKGEGGGFAKPWLPRSNTSRAQSLSRKTNLCSLTLNWSVLFIFKSPRRCGTRAVRKLELHRSLSTSTSKSSRHVLTTHNRFDGVAERERNEAVVLSSTGRHAVTIQKSRGRGWLSFSTSRIIRTDISTLSYDHATKSSFENFPFTTTLARELSPVSSICE